jgi:hypothetical protein
MQFVPRTSPQDPSTLSPGARSVVTAARLRRLRLWRKYASKALGAAPPPLRIAALTAAALGVLFALNIAYHLIRKPTEILFPFGGALNKTPAETWRHYAPLFNAYSTAAIPPELLAALAQVESSGNPMARTYWRWRLTWNPFEIYQPASSAVGMYQLTDGAFADARRYCVRNHTVMAAGSWSDWGPCWFNRFYSRVVPSHAVELAAAALDRNVRKILARRPGAKANVQKMQDLAVLIHLCGSGRAKAYARRGFQLRPGERCGDHDAAAYLARVNAMTRQFRLLAASDR